MDVNFSSRSNIREGAIRTFLELNFTNWLRKNNQNIKKHTFIYTLHSRFYNSLLKEKKEKQKTKNNETKQQRLRWVDVTLKFKSLNLGERMNIFDI